MSSARKDMHIVADTHERALITTHQC
eukprot:SAG31_NODE_11521_length_1021_cov_1.579176_2_plen_25_part_01